jgi:hypothetical protein
MRKAVWIGGLSILALAFATPSAASQDRPNQRPAGWSVEPRAATDLWFHGLAVIGYEEGGGGLFPLYDSNYVRAVQQAKRDMGVYPTPLDSAAAEILGEIRSHDALQVFHFLPLYFSRAGPNEMLAALRAVADQRSRDSAVAGPDVRFGAFITAQSLTRGSERRALKHFVELLQQEWDLFYRQYWDVFWRGRLGMLDEARRLWTDDLGVLLEPYLSSAYMESGMIIPTPTLGFEGRINSGDLYDPRDNVIAVHLAMNDMTPLSIAYGAVRELCFSVLDRVPELGAVNPEYVERVRAIAAVRCGAYLLEFYAPAYVTGYWQWFLAAAGMQPSGGLASAFAKAYPLTPEVEQGLRRAMRGR